MFKVYRHSGISKIVSVFLVQIGLNTAQQCYFHGKAEVKTRPVKLFLISLNGVNDQTITLCQLFYENFVTLLTFTCSKSAIETIKKCVKSVQS